MDSVRFLSYVEDTGLQRRGHNWQVRRCAHNWGARANRQIKQMILCQVIAYHVCKRRRQRVSPPSWRQRPVMRRASSSVKHALLIDSRGIFLDDAASYLFVVLSFLYAQIFIRDIATFKGYGLGRSLPNFYRLPPTAVPQPLLRMLMPKHRPGGWLWDNLWAYMSCGIRRQITSGISRGVGTLLGHYIVRALANGT